jgi:hypothetical protein
MEKCSFLVWSTSICGTGEKGFAARYRAVKAAAS